MRILCLGDSPFLTTGFGVVNRVATDHLLSLGHELIVVGSQDTSERTKPGMTFIPTENKSVDRMGWAKVPEVIEKYRPDMVHIIGDSAMMCIWMIHEELQKLPVLGYVPVEGAPSYHEWIKVFSANENLTLVTCSKFGQEELAKNFVYAKLAYHGVSPAFTKQPDHVRSEWRRALGWEDKIVVMSVAQNVRRKQWPRLLEAIKIVQKKHPEVILYAHTVPMQDHWLEGWDLSSLAAEMGIWDKVIFPPDLRKLNDSAPLNSIDGVMPGLVDLYNASDMFCLVSQVEGFGLPLAEAMACGLPVITTDYAAGAEVVGNAGVLVKPHDWEICKSHARYANVAPVDVASEISRLAKSPELRKTYSRRAVERANLFKWDDYRSILTEFYGDAQTESRAA